MQFSSDNLAGVSPAIMRALTEVSAGPAIAYGDDALTKQTEQKVAALFETECAVFFVATGSAANSIGLAALCPNYGAILCHEGSHIQTDECGCPEFYTGGAKLLPIAGDNGKLCPDNVIRFIESYPNHAPHATPIKVLALTQGTEFGTVYNVDEVRELGKLKRERGLRMHMDGARFANAIIATGATPAEITWQAGVDILSLGATKNGCLAAEAVVCFDLDLADEIMYRRKRGGHLWSKSRFISAQFKAWLDDDLWLANARHANRLGQRLSAGLAAIDGIHIPFPTQINEIFASMPSRLIDDLLAAGAQFHRWACPGTGGDPNLIRLVTSFESTDQEVDAFVDLTRQLSRRAD